MNKSRVNNFKKKILIAITILILFIVIFSGISLGIILSYIKENPPLESLDYYLPPQVSKIYDREGTKVIKELYYVEKRVKKTTECYACKSYQSCDSDRGRQIL